MFYMGENSIKNMEGVEFSLKQVTYRALVISKVDFGIPSTGGLRTQAEQKALFAAGKSKADGTNSVSKHQLGQAIDMYAYVDGKASWDHYHLVQVATAFLQAAIELDIPIKWGGFFHSFTDMPHFELIIKETLEH